MFWQVVFENKFLAFVGCQICREKVASKMMGFILILALVLVQIVSAANARDTFNEEYRLLGVLKTASRSFAFVSGSNGVYSIAEGYVFPASAEKLIYILEDKIILLGSHGYRVGEQKE